ncbi:MAG: hypothetical protein LWX56_12710 [Ignavibacteria bacterium]|nr:hypothetical protein [Ignavibacteria bacterium]
MKQFNEKDFEQLSAYLDGELSASDKQKMEERLQQSPSLREKLHELAETKNQVGSLKGLQYDPYFETRLFEKISRKHDNLATLLLSRKPVIALTTFTIVILVVFRFNPGFIDNILEANKKSAAEFYAANLKPLFYATSLTNDDILNFAFNQVLPINKENHQVLSFGSGHSGEDILEVKDVVNTKTETNVDAFMHKFGIDAGKKPDVTRILQKYSDKIASAVLVKQNGVAVSSALWDCHQQLRRELLGFVSENSKSGVAISVRNELANIPAPKEPAELGEVFYYLSPDTFFTSQLPVNRNQIKQEIAEYKSQINEQGAKAAKTWQKVNLELRKLGKLNMALNSGYSIEFNTDSNVCRVIIPSETMPQKSRHKVDFAAKRIDSVFSTFKDFNPNMAIFGNGRQVDVDLQLHKNGNQLYYGNGNERLVGSNPQSYYRQYSAPERDGNTSQQGSGSRKIYQMEVLDSLNKIMRIYLHDSLQGPTPSNLSKGLDDFKHEMEQFRAEIERLRKEIKAEQQKKAKTQDTKNPVEI